MTVAALLDAGAAIERLRAGLAALPLSGYELASETVKRGACRATRFHVTLDDACMQPSRRWLDIKQMIEVGEKAGLPARVASRSLAAFEALARAEAKVHGCALDEVHFHEVGAVDSIVDIVGAFLCLEDLGVERCFVGPLPLGSGTTADVTTTDVTTADGTIAGETTDAGIHSAGIPSGGVPSGGIPGGGNAGHGVIPIPAPATVELLRGFEVVAGDGSGETVTPTGAAILRAVAKPLRPSFRLDKHGSGAGSRELDDRPNILRVLLGDAEEQSDSQAIVIEADIDDMSPEAVSYAVERLRGAGVLDAGVQPLGMKKGRLGMRLSVLCAPADLERLAAMVLAETSTIGLRYRAMRRMVLARRLEIVDTEFGPIAVKVVERPVSERPVSEGPTSERSESRHPAEEHPAFDPFRRLAGSSSQSSSRASARNLRNLRNAPDSHSSSDAVPEFADVARAAAEHGRPFIEVYEAAVAAFGRRARPAGDS